jgi:hypothetical protein
VTDATSAIIAVILLFCCPKDNIFKGREYKHLVDWNMLQKVFPWSIFFLIGGGLVMAAGFEVLMRLFNRKEAEKNCSLKNSNILRNPD